MEVLRVSLLACGLVVCCGGYVKANESPHEEYVGFINITEDSSNSSLSFSTLNITNTTQLGDKRTFQIGPVAFSPLPWLTLASSGFRLNRPSQELSIPEFVNQGFRNFVDSLSVRVTVPQGTSRSIGSALRYAFAGRRKRIREALLMGGLVSALTMMSLGVAAMAGKALMMSLASIMLSFLANRNSGGGSSHGGGGGGGGSSAHHAPTAYEVITHSVAAIPAAMSAIAAGKAKDDTYTYVQPLTDYSTQYSTIHNHHERASNNFIAHKLL